MTNRERLFWIAIRAALLAMVDAIERYAEIGKHKQREEVLNSDCAVTN